MHQIDKMKDKSHMIISINAEKVFSKTQHSFTIKLSKVLIKGSYFHIMKAIYENPTANIILNGKTLKALPL